MENDSSFSNESTTPFILPIGAVAFVPFLLLELVAAIVSNAILLALVILACVKKLNNNINIYLFSLAIGGLIGAFNLICLLSLIVARRWVLGLFMCNVSYCVVLIYYMLLIIIYLIISRDKLKGVKDPLYGRPTNKRAYVNTIVLWIVSIVFGLLFLSFSWNFFTTRIEVFGDFACFGLTSRLADEENRFIFSSLSISIYWLISSVIILVTFSNFVRILWELRKLKKLRQQFVNRKTSKVVRINNRYKPLYRTGEERTAKSLALAFFIQFICILISSSMLYIQAILRNYVLHEEVRNSADFQIYFVILLIVQHYPCIAPIFLIWSNKRLRTRVKELFKCTLNPEVESSPIHAAENTEPTPMCHFTPKTNKVSPLNF